MGWEAEVAEYWATVYTRRNFNGGEKVDIYRRDKGKCRYCGKTLQRKRAVYDHAVPYRAGGPTLVENGALSCKRCNNAKITWDKKQPFDSRGIFFRQVLKAVGYHQPEKAWWSGSLYAAFVTKLP